MRVHKIWSEISYLCLRTWSYKLQKNELWACFNTWGDSDFVKRDCWKYSCTHLVTHTQHISTATKSFYMCKLCVHKSFLTHTQNTSLGNFSTLPASLCTGLFLMTKLYMWTYAYLAFRNKQSLSLRSLLPLFCQVWVAANDSQDDAFLWYGSTYGLVSFKLDKLRSAETTITECDSHCQCSP